MSYIANSIDYSVDKWYKYTINRGECMIIEKIEDLKKKLNEEIEMGCSYSQILKTSEDIDKLLAEYYLKDIKNIT